MNAPYRISVEMIDGKQLDLSIVSNSAGTAPPSESCSWFSQIKPTDSREISAGLRIGPNSNSWKGYLLDQVGTHEISCKLSSTGDTFTQIVSAPDHGVPKLVAEPNTNDCDRLVTILPGSAPGAAAARTATGSTAKTKLKTKAVIAPPAAKPALASTLKVSAKICGAKGPEEYRNPTTGKVSDPVVKQWVNLTSVNGGIDGHGSSVEITFGPEGFLKDPTLTWPDSGTVHIATVFTAAGGFDFRCKRTDSKNAWGVNAIAGANATSSPKTDPKTKRLIPTEETLPINGLALKIKGVIYVHEMPVTKGGSPFSIKLDLGIAGGDQCRVCFGETIQYESGSVLFENWRRIEYETIIHPCMEDYFDITPNAKYEFPSPIKSQVDLIFAEAFIEAKVIDSVVFSDATAPGVLLENSELNIKYPGYKYIDCPLWVRPPDVPPSTLGKAAIRIYPSYALLDDEKVEDMTFAEVAYTNAPKPYTVANLRPQNTSNDMVLSKPIPPTSNTIDFSSCTWEAAVDPNKHKSHPNVSFILGYTSHRPPATNDYCIISELSRQKTEISFVELNLPQSTKITNSPDLKKIVAFLQACSTVAKAYENEGTIRFSINLWKNGKPSPSGHPKIREIEAFINNQIKTFPTIPIHPGLDVHGKRQTGPMDPNWLTGKPTAFQLTLKFPTRKPGQDRLPGDFVGPKETATTCPIVWRINLQRVGVFPGISRPEGDILLSMYGNPERIAELICHELGHKMGLAPFVNGPPPKNPDEIIQTPKPEPEKPTIKTSMDEYDPFAIRTTYKTENRVAVAPGMNKPLHVDEGGTYYHSGNKNTSTGIRSNGHKGSHCSYGISPISLLNPPGTPPPGSCIMYGDGNMRSSAKVRKFCPNCLETLKSRTLEDLSSPWLFRF